MSGTRKRGVFFFIYFSSLFLAVSSFHSAFLKVYSNKSPNPWTVFSKDCPYGATFNVEIQKPTCVCLSGLWAFYEDACTSPSMITGTLEKTCFPFEEISKIAKVQLLSPPSGDLHSGAVAVFNNDMTLMKGRSVAWTWSEDNDVSRLLLPYAHVGDMMITMHKGNSSIQPKCSSDVDDCTNLSEPSFCIHEGGNKSAVHDWKDSSNVFKPITCVPLMPGSDDTCQPLHRSKRSARKNNGRRGRGFSGRKGRRLNSRPKKGRTHQGRSQLARRPHGRSQLGREHQGRSQQSTKRKYQGRVFFPASIKLGAEKREELKPETLEDNDEDKNLPVSNDSIHINSQLWNYYTVQAEETLGLSKSDKMHYTTPALRFLQLAKDIIKKSCPDHYVKDDWFDMAVGAFLALQTTSFKYDTMYSDLATTKRIEAALYDCLETAKEYPFVNRKMEAGGDEEQCAKNVSLGTYKAFGKTLEFNFQAKYSSRSVEPVIETAWKTFLHAHSACFDSFKRHNDHHHFTAMMIPLFTNEIGTLWADYELSKDSYGGMLGDAIQLMDSVDYCALYSRLNSGYPWDLPRPVVSKPPTKSAGDDDSPTDTGNDVEKSEPTEDQPIPEETEPSQTEDAEEATEPVEPAEEAVEKPTPEEAGEATKPEAPAEDAKESAPDAEEPAPEAEEAAEPAPEEGDEPAPEAKRKKRSTYTNDKQYQCLRDTSYGLQQCSKF